MQQRVRNLSFFFLSLEFTYRVSSEGSSGRHRSLDHRKNCCHNSFDIFLLLSKLFATHPVRPSFNYCVQSVPWADGACIHLAMAVQLVSRCHLSQTCRTLRKKKVKYLMRVFFPVTCMCRLAASIAALVGLLLEKSPMKLLPYPTLLYPSVWAPSTLKPRPS